jgi:hypothetical protein
MKDIAWSYEDNAAPYSQLINIINNAQKLTVCIHQIIMALGKRDITYSV